MVHCSNHSIIQHVPTTDANETKVDQLYEDLQDLRKLTSPPKNVLFIIGDWNAKVGGKEVPRVIGKFGPGIQNEAKANRVLSRECTGHSKHTLTTTQEMTLHVAFTRRSILKLD